MSPALPFSYPGIGADVRRLGEFLKLVLRTSGWNAPEAPAILNLACGRADETGELLNAISPFARELFYLGIDLRPAEAAEGKARWVPAAPPGWQLDFRAGDASRTDRMRQLFAQLKEIEGDPPRDESLGRRFWNKFKEAFGT